MSKRRKKLEITTLTGRITGLDMIPTGEKYAGEMQVQASSSLEKTTYTIMVPTNMIDWVPANPDGKKVTVEVDTDWAGPEYVMRSVSPAQEYETEGRNGGPPGITLTTFHQNDTDKVPHSRGPWNVYELPCPSCGQTYGGVHMGRLQTATLGPMDAGWRRSTCTASRDAPPRSSSATTRVPALPSGGREWSFPRAGRLYPKQNERGPHADQRRHSLDLTFRAPGTQCWRNPSPAA